MGAAGVEVFPAPLPLPAALCAVEEFGCSCHGEPHEESTGWSSQPQVAGFGPGILGDTTQSRIVKSRMPWIVEPRLPGKE